MLPSVLAAASLCSPAASATPAVVQDLKPVSGASPFPDSCKAHVEPGRRDAESEPTIAVNPKDPRNIVITMQWDFDEGGFLVSATKDGGRTWKNTVLPGVGPCAGGTNPFSPDTWISIGPDGVVYVASMLIDSDSDIDFMLSTFPSRMAVSRSGDGGLSWSPPVVVAQGRGLDHEGVTADPRVPGRVYLTWSDFEGEQPGRLGSADSYFSRSDDGGRSWSSPRRMFRGSDAPPYWALGNDPLVLPDGSLVYPFLNGIQNDFLPGGVVALPWAISSVRSEDGGASWSAATKIADISTGGRTHYPDEPHGAGETFTARTPDGAVAPDGAVYVVWSDPESSTSGKILFSRSMDGGRSFTPPKLIASVGAAALTPTVAVAGDDTVGVTYHDFRNDRAGDSEVTTDWWFAHSHDRGASWRESHLAGPFDMKTAFDRRGDNDFIGDYFGLAAVPGGFAAALVQAQPKATKGPSDVFFARVEVGCADAAGQIRGRRLHRAVLGRTRESTRRSYAAGRTRGAYDYFCLADGKSVRVGHPTPKLRQTLGRRGFRRARDRAVLILTDSRGFGLRGVRVGMRLGAMRDRLRGERRVHRGRGSTWYALRGRSATLVFRVRGGRVRELGIAARSVAGTVGGAKRLIRSYGA